MWLGALSPNGRLLLTLGVHRGQLWDSGSGKLLHSYQVAKDIVGDRPELYGAEFTRDGRKVLVWTEESDELWDVATGRRSANFDDAEGSVLSPTDDYSLPTALAAASRFEACRLQKFCESFAPEKEHQSTT